MRWQHQKPELKLTWILLVLHWNKGPTHPDNRIRNELDRICLIYWAKIVRIQLNKLYIWPKLPRFSRFEYTTDYKVVVLALAQVLS